MKKCLAPECTVTPRNGDYCSKHKKQTIKVQHDAIQPDLNTISETQGIVSHAPRTSSFMITLSNGKTANTNGNGERDKFANIVQQLYANKKIEKFIYDIDNQPLNIDSCDITSGPLEVGTVRGKLNHHATVIVKHKNKIRINLNRLRDECKRILGSEMFVRIKLIKDPNAMVQNYASKTI